MSFDVPSLPDGWAYVSLDSCCKSGSITYGIVQPGSPVNEGIPVIRVNNFQDTQLNLNEVMRVDPVVEAKYSRTRLNGGEVLLTIVGSVGQVAVAPKKIAGFNVARAVAVIEPLPHVSADWIALCLRSPLSQHLLGSRANTTVQTTINLKDLRALPIPLPPVEERNNIAGVIGALDDRVTLLRETNDTLEAIAQALFKSWFVDFDPVRAKMEGRAPEGMDEATAALFPDSFEETELGMVPRGWQVRPIGELINTLGGATPDTKNEGYWTHGTHHWTSPKDLSGLASPVLLDTERRISDAGLAKISSGLLPSGTLLMSSRAPIGYLAVTQVPLAINQGYIAMPPGGRLPPLFMLFWCRQNMDSIKGRANGSTFMEISKKAFRPIPAVEPAGTVVQAFVDAAGTLFSRLVENEKQAQSLKNLRDNLLPRLISGQIRLPDVESLLAEAA